MPKITFPKEMAEKLVKKITLEMVYKVVEEKTTEIKEDIAELRQKQEEDFRYLSQRIDTLGAQLNQRMDTMMQMLMEISRQMMELSKQKN
jgi:acetyl-CoA carboxylase alpha subunit